MIAFFSSILGIWRVISRTAPNKEGYIHRLTTKDIERIHKQDVQNERLTPRSYICTKDIEAFDVLLRLNGKFFIFFYLIYFFKIKIQLL